MFSASLLSSVLLALAVSANPVTNIVNLYQNDFNRAQALKAQGTDNVANKFISTPALNDDVHSIARVDIGSPPTPYDLVVDTGRSVISSANTERFYTVYDTTNKRVDIANTPFAYAKTN